MKILIIRFSSIGDIVLTTPVIRCIKKCLPDAEIHYLTKASYQSLFVANPYISKIHLLENNWSGLMEQLKQEQYHLVVDLHNNLRSWKVRMALRKKSVVFNKINLEKWLYVRLRINWMPRMHIVDRYLEAVKAIGISNDGEGLDYFIPAHEYIKPEELPLTHLHGYIAIAIGAQHATKKLPVEKLRRLVTLLPYPIILLGGKEDEEAGEKIREADPVKVFNGCGKYSLNQSASLIRQAQLVITHDTGMMHVAAAFHKKIISIWGNTVPAFGMYPYFGSARSFDKDYRDKSRMVEVKGLWCRPCSKLGYQKCPLGHFNCMNRIDEQAVADLVSRL